MTFDDLWWPQFWPEVKNDRYDFVMNSDELSIVFFRLSIRRLGAEIDGGVFKHPPHEVVENPEAHEGAG